MYDMTHVSYIPAFLTVCVCVFTGVCVCVSENNLHSTEGRNVEEARDNALKKRS